jgi:excinuclease ABC subunit A
MCNGHIWFDAWFHDLDSRLSDKQQRIATEVIKEIKDRLNF